MLNYIALANVLSIGVSLCAASDTRDCLLQTIPSDVVFAYLTVPPPSSAPDSPASLDSIRGLVDSAYGLGLLAGLDSEVRCWLDSLNAFTDVLDYPHTFMLFDIKARARSDGGHELSGLKAALALHTNGKNEGLNRRIQHLLNTYTNSEETALRCEGEGASATCKLSDRRMPDWLTVQWQAIGDFFVVTIGDGVLERVRETIIKNRPNLGSNSWLKDALHATSTSRPSTICYLNMQTLRPALDRSLQQKVDHVLAVLNWENVERALLVFDQKDRYSVVEGVASRNGRDTRFELLGPQFVPGPEDKVIPKEATRVAAIHCQPREFLNGLCDAYLAARSVRARESIRSSWLAVQNQCGVSIEADIAGALDNGIIIHDYPPHALKLPFARTIVLRVKDRPDKLRENVDKLLSLVKENPEWISPMTLHHDDDGIWSLNLGFSGPALKVTDEWVIISFSPQAVRQVLAVTH